MQTKDLRRLLDVLRDTDVSELTLETGEYKLTLKRGFGAPQAVLAPAAPHLTAATPLAAEPAAAPTPAQAAEAPAAERLVDVVAPIVGTFYAAPSPEAPPFVRVG